MAVVIIKVLVPLANVFIVTISVDFLVIHSVFKSCNLVVIEKEGICGCLVDE